MTVRITTIAIRITDCAADEPMLRLTKPVAINLVDQNVWWPANRPPALRRGALDDAEGVEHGVDDVHDEEEEGHRRQQREDDRPEPLHAAGAIDCGGLDEGIGDRLKACQEEQEIVADLLPGGCDEMIRIKSRPCRWSGGSSCSPILQPHRA